ncbi:polysaccharide ABC transporter ATP-binding protein [Paenibacillus sp. MY03]|jgi:putative aldouronate transport system permease protein|uniref:ABC transporter permease n=1 Tax=Paenibacillus sp. MY03 TaxID=302980 RepID=UPI000B3D2BA0|nr:sugar ABC transporter permease [Paenibacillus sp. MY03]OUS78155.1 polysaccharide ABC transporter ATP-binding protein [Paenibacillus sp. MY03]
MLRQEINPRGKAVKVESDVLRKNGGKFRKHLKEVSRDKYLYLLALPGILYFIIFKYVPMYGILIAFQDFSPYLGFSGSSWVGWEHFQRLFTEDDFWQMLRNTLAISFLNIAMFFPLPIILSILLNELSNQYYKRTIQSLVYLPHFLSWVIIASLTLMLFGKSEGIINYFLNELGFGTVDFLTNPSTFWFLLTGQSIWKEIGWGTIIFLAAIAGVNTELYEAARIDGANRFRQIWHVTLPTIRNVIVILLILRLGDVLEVGFEQVFLMYNGAVSDVAEIFDTYVYRVGIQQGQFSYSTAVGLFKSFVGLVLVVIANRLVKRFGEEGLY